MFPRVTQQTIARDTISGLQQNINRLQTLQNELSSGRRVNRPSDDPVQTSAALQIRADVQRTSQYGRNISDGLARLHTADSALGEASTMVARVRQLVVAGLNDTNGSGERSAMADEVDTLQQSLIGIANTQYLGQAVFAGTVDSTRLATPTATAQAYDPATGAYLGNSADVLRTTAAGVQVQVNVTGDQAFGTLFNDPSAAAGAGILTRISTALRAGDTTGLTTALGELDNAASNLSAAQGLVGARTNRLTTIQSDASAHLDAAKASLSDAESIDLPQTIMDLQLQQTAYQAALGASARVIQPTLLDFLR